MADDLPAVFEQDVAGVFAALSDQLGKRAMKGRRQRRGEITLDNVPPSFQKVFDYWVSIGLWKPVLRPGSDAPEFWSCKPEACDVLCNFHEMYSEVVREGRTKRARREADKDGGLAPYRMAGGSSVVGPRGDICTICPPLFGRLQKHAVGTSGKLVRYSARFWFSLGVIPASVGAPDSNDEDQQATMQEETIRLFLHEKYPDFKCFLSWPQVPGYEDPAAHFVRHLQRTIRDYELDPRSLAVTEVKAMDFNKPELAPPCNVFLVESEARSVKGRMFDEERGEYVIASTKARKHSIWSKNLRVHNKRRADSEKTLDAYNKRLRGEPFEDSDSGSGSEYGPDDSDVEWAEREFDFLQRHY